MSSLTEEEKEEVSTLFKKIPNTKNPHDRTRIYHQILDILDPYLEASLEAKLDEQFENLAECRDIHRGGRI